MINNFKMYFLVLFISIASNYSIAETKSSYSIDPNWPTIPNEITLGQATGVAVDYHNHVFIFHRADREWTEPFPVEKIKGNTVIMFDGTTGEFINTWGGNQFIMPHGLSIDHNNNVWVTDVGSQQIYKFSHNGELLLNIGEANVQGNDERHFALPSDLSVLKDGSVYVSDGYENTRVIKFTSSGKFKMQWGTPGNLSGQFNLPHGIATNNNRIYVADRGNSRLQIFDHKGTYISEWKGKHIGRPYGVATLNDNKVLIIDGGDQPQNTRSRVIILNSNGDVIESFSAKSKLDLKNLGHDIAVGIDGSIYVVDAWANSVRKYIKNE